MGGGTGGAGGAIAPPIFAILLSKQPCTSNIFSQICKQQHHQFFRPSAASAQYDRRQEEETGTKEVTGQVKNGILLCLLGVFYETSPGCLTRFKSCPARLRRSQAGQLLNRGLDNQGRLSRTPSRRNMMLCWFFGVVFS